jgi:hypothetical protein
MKTYVTTLTAINQVTRELVKFEGQRITATCWDEAEGIVRRHFPYLSVEGEFVCEIDEDTGIQIPQWEKLN